MTWTLPWALLLAPLAWGILWLLERFRRRPPVVRVADVGLFVVTDAARAEARARRRRRSLAFWLRVLAVGALTLAIAGPRGQTSPTGRVVDLVVDRGLPASWRLPDGARAWDALRAEADALLEQLDPGDRVRLHLCPPEGAVTPADPAEVRARLAGLEPVAAWGDLAGQVAEVAARGARSAAVWGVAARAVEWPEGVAGVEVRGGGADWGIVSASVTEEGTYVGVRGTERGRVTVTAQFRGEGEFEARTQTLEVGADGALVAFEGAPEGWERLELGLEGEDACGLNDRGWVVRGSAPQRVVGVVGSVGEDVLRALRAVGGVEVREWASLPGREEQGECAVWVVPKEPAVPLATATVVIPGRLRRPERGGLVRALAPGAAGEAFRFTRRLLEGTPCRVERLGEVELEGETLLEVEGGQPFAVWRGQGPTLRVGFAAPLDRGTDWPRLPSFPVFWAELVAFAAPGGGAAAEARVAGVAGAPLRVGWEAGVGTVAGTGPGWSPGRRAPPERAMLAPLVEEGAGEGRRWVWVGVGWLLLVGGWAFQNARDRA